MNINEIIGKIEEIKKEEIAYAVEVFEEARRNNLGMDTKLQIYRRMNEYKRRLYKLSRDLFMEYRKINFTDNKRGNKILYEVDFSRELEKYDPLKYYQVLRFLDELEINPENLKFEISLNKLRSIVRMQNVETDMEALLWEQKFLNEPVYIYLGEYDDAENCYGPGFGCAEYSNFCEVFKKRFIKSISKNRVKSFIKNNTIIDKNEYIDEYEVESIFKEQLGNSENQTYSECIDKTREIVKRIGYERSPEYKEKKLLEKINLLYSRVKGEYISSEVLYSGKFLQFIKETYKLPTGKSVDKEKVVKNGGKDSVIIIPLTEDGKYLLTCQNRIKDKMILEFPSGYIENGEKPERAAKRELLEETGFYSENFTLIDKAYTTPGTDNSTSYIVLANFAYQKGIPKKSNSEYLEFKEFTKEELDYLVENGYLLGAMNKLAYYNLIYKTEEQTTYKENKIVPYRKIK